MIRYQKVKKQYKFNIKSLKKKLVDNKQKLETWEEEG